MNIYTWIAVTCVFILIAGGMRRLKASVTVIAIFAALLIAAPLVRKS
jgi:hypothetical protein